MHNPEPEIFYKSDPCRSPKILVQPQRRKKDLQKDRKVTKHGTHCPPLPKI